ncbi:MAG: orotidine-5'-phosphate decarboxylase [bacterium]|nr:orotidine-5'-phosphate decarboxylase [bacterium]
MKGNTQLITAVDVDDRDEAMAIVDSAEGCDWFKIGSQLFVRWGPDIVRDIAAKGKRIFLDLKFHDIPNTVAKAAKGAAELEVGLFTLHAAGGRKMIHMARKAVEGTKTRILAVTILTSFDDKTLRSDVGLYESAAEAVGRYAKLAVDAGAHGIVCSPHEIGIVREAVGPDPTVVTPGVRPAWASADDQARIMTPADASKAGASFIVVGRPIVKNDNPAEAVRSILEELNG